MDALFEQIINISKAHAYDIVSKQVQELTVENNKLKERIKFLDNLLDEYKTLINEYTVDWQAKYKLDEPGTHTYNHKQP